MGRLDQKFAKLSEQGEAGGPEAEASKAVERMSALNKPEQIPQHVWTQIQENGEKAVSLLNEILYDRNFHRLKPSDKEKLLRLAMDRAYGPAAKQFDATPGGRNSKVVDVTARLLHELADRTALPEYRRHQVEEAEVLDSPGIGDEA